jgi:hypothetical protein
MKIEQTWESVLSVIWNEPKHRMCPLKSMAFCDAAEIVDGQETGIDDENGRHVYRFTGLEVIPNED